jgi:uncharacterized membrane protein
MRGEPGVDVILMPDASAEAPFFTVRLCPRRSLSQRGRRTALAILALLQGAIGGFFSLAGAWPAAVFLGLAWFGLAFAFGRNARDALAFEELSLSTQELRYARVNPAGARREWRFNPLWVRLMVERHAEFGVERLDLSTRGKRVEVAACLGRGEKTLLAADLSGALARARRGARFS